MFFSFLQRLLGRKSKPRSARVSPWRLRALPLTLDELEARLVLSNVPIPAYFDFGTTTSPVASGYTRVSNTTLYSATQGYGWLLGVVSAQDRGTGGALDQDFNATANNTFAVNLANGVYNVQVTMGDASSARSHMGVFLQGNQVDDVSTAADQFSTKTYQVTVSNGQLDLGLKSLASTSAAVINALSITTAKPPVLSSGGPYTAIAGIPVGFSGYAPKMQDEGASLTYSWDFGDGSSGSGPNPHHTYASQGTYAVTLSATDASGDAIQPVTTTVQVLPAVNGVANVGLTPGWATFGEAPPEGEVFGNLQVGNLPTQTDIKTRWADGSVRYAIVTVDVPVSGTYAVTAAPAPAATFSGAAEPTAGPAPLHYDFGTATSPVAPGYTQVTETSWLGAGQSYGWIAGSINSLDRGTGTGTALTEDMDRTADGTFAVDLPNGSYSVTLTMGDTTAHSGMGVYLQGTQVDTVSTAAKQYVSKTYSVNVSNGQLDLRLTGTSAMLPAILNALDITPADLPAATAPDFPENVMAQGASSNLMDISWNASPGAADYLVQRSSDGVSGWTQVGSTTSTDYQDSGLQSSTTYYYRVIAENSTGDSSPSGITSASTALTGVQNPNVQVIFTIGSTVYTATLPSAPSQDLWLSGPLVSENRTIVDPVATDGTLQPYLRVYFDTDNYKGGGSRVSVDVENDLNVAGDTAITYSVQIVASGQVVYQHDTLSQGYLTRWRQVFDVGTTASQVTPDFTPFQESGALPSYLSVMNNTVDSPTGSNFDILGDGGLNPAMATVGGRPEIAPYPDWAARYIEYDNPTQGQYVLAEGNLAGSWPVHLRQPDGSMINIDTDPNFAFVSKVNPSATILEVPKGDMTATGPLVPDTAHTPSLAYIPYLVSGDRYYGDEMSFWGAYGLSKSAPYARNYTQGLLYPGQQERTLAWQLRNVSDAAAYLPQNNPMASYFGEKVTNNLQWADTYATAHQTPLGTSFEWTRNGHVGVSLFMDSYLVWAIDHANALGFAGGDVAKNQIDQLITSLFTSSSFTKTEALTEELYVGTVNSDNSWTYDQSLAQVANDSFTTGGLPTDEVWYSENFRFVLADAALQNMAGAQDAYDWLYPLSVPYIAKQAGWAIDLQT